MYLRNSSENANRHITYYTDVSFPMKNEKVKQNYNTSLCDTPIYDRICACCLSDVSCHEVVVVVV